MKAVTRTRLVVAVVVLVTLGVATAVGTRSLWSGVDAEPELRVATNDAEWLRLIEEARKRRADAGAPWPERTYRPE